MITNKVKINEYLITEHEYGRAVYIDNKRYEGTFSEAKRQVMEWIDAENQKERL